MAVYPIPDELNQMYQQGHNRFTDALKSILMPQMGMDISQNLWPQQSQQMAMGGLPEMIANAIRPGDIQESLQNGIIGLGMAPIKPFLRPYDSQPIRAIASREPYHPQMQLMNHESPYLLSDGRLTDPRLPHLYGAENYSIKGLNSTNMGSFLHDTSSIRLMGANDSLNVEMAKLPTKEQFKTIKILAGDRPIYFDFVNDKMKIQKSGEATNFMDFLKKVLSE